MLSDTADVKNTNAVLHYLGAPDEEPAGTPPNVSANKLVEADLKPFFNPAAPGKPIKGPDGVDRAFEFNFTTQFDQTEGLKFLINNHYYEPPTVPTLLHILTDGARSDADFQPSEATHVIERGQTVEITIRGPPGHPFHLQ